MTSNGLSIVQCIFSSVWQLFTCFHIPGTAVTPAMWAFFILAAGFGLRFLLSWSKAMPSAETSADLSRNVSLRRMKHEKVSSKSSSVSYKSLHPEVFGK